MAAGDRLWLLHSFTLGIRRGYDAVKNGLTSSGAQEQSRATSTG
jgi:hypothetical protein